MRYLRPLLVGAVLAVLLASAPFPAHAAGEVATRIVIDPLETLTVGSEASLVVTLTQEDGIAVVDEPIALTIDGVSRARRWTDAAGVATFHLPRDLPPGEHEVVATYAGRTNAFLGATTRAVVDIVPHELAIGTVPPLPGMVFEIDGTRFEAGADGVARIGLDRLGEYTLTALPSAYRHPDQRVEFSRWSNESFGPTINIRAPLEVSLYAGFDISYQASLAFVDPHGNAVDNERIEEVTLRNSIGATITTADGRSRWYKAIRTIRRPAGLDSVPIRYTVEQVIVDGENVVNVGQQRFDVEPRVAWPVELLLYSVRMVPNDAFFGFPLGESVILTYPSGSTTRIDAVDGEFTADGLARGLYRVQVADAPGWSPVTPIALSRDQEVRVRVITYVDMAVVILTGMGVALGLLHVGRPHLAPAAMAGAKGVVSVARSPRTIGALFARRRTAATPATPMSPAVVTAHEFVLPPVRPERSSAGRSEPLYAPPAPRASVPGTVPIAQVIRATLGTAPATRAEAAALPPPPPVLTAPPAVTEPAPIAQPAPPVLAPSTAIAGGKAASLAARTGDEQRKPRRTRSSRGVVAKQPPSRKARGTTDASPGLPTIVGDAATPRRRRGSRARPDASIVAEPVTEPQADKPVRAKAPRKRTSAQRKADAQSPEPRDEDVVAPLAPTTSVSSTPVDATPTGRAKSRKARAKADTTRRTPKAVGASKKRRPPAPAAANARPSKPRSAKKAALLPDVMANAEPTMAVSDALAGLEAPPSPMPPEQTGISRTAQEESTSEPPAKPRSTKKAVRLPDPGAITMADGVLPDASVGETPPPATFPEQPSVALTATAEAKTAARPPEGSPTATAERETPDAPVHDPPELPAPPDQTSSPLTATDEPTAGRRSKPRSTKTPAARARPPKRSAKKTEPDARPPKRSVKKTEPDARPPKGSAKKTAAGARPPKRSQRNAAALLEVTASLTAHGALPDAAVDDGPELSPPLEQTKSVPVATEEPTGSEIAIDGAIDAASARLDQVSADATVSAAELPSDGPPPTAQPQPEERRSRQVELIASVVRVLPHMPALSDRLARSRVAALECTGCHAALKPGARFCRRCGHVTPVGELERQRLS